MKVFKAFIDTNIPMYAAGQEHPLKAGCLEIMRSVANGDLEAYTDTEVFQEILYRYFSIKRGELGLQVFDTFSKIMHGAVLAVRFDDVVLARKLINWASYAKLSPRDVIQLAVMQNNGIDHIITADRVFEEVEGIRVIRV